MEKCVFCGYEEPELITKQEVNPDVFSPAPDTVCGVQCPKCGAKGPCIVVRGLNKSDNQYEAAVEEAQKKAIKLWNREK